MEQTEHLRVSWCVNAVWTILQVLTFKIMAFVVFSLLEGISMRNMLSEIKSWNTIKKKRKEHGYISVCMLLPTIFLSSLQGHAICIKCTRLRKTVTYKKAGTLSCSAQIRGNLEVFKTENLSPPSPPRYISQVCNISQVFSIQTCHFHFC